MTITPALLETIHWSMNPATSSHPSLASTPAMTNASSTSLRPPLLKLSGLRRRCFSCQTKRIRALVIGRNLAALARRAMSFVHFFLVRA